MGREPHLAVPMQPAGTSQEVRAKRCNVGPPLPKWRYRHVLQREPPIEIFAKCVHRGCPAKISGAKCDDANVVGDEAPTPVRLESSFFDCP